MIARHSQGARPTICHAPATPGVNARGKFNGWLGRRFTGPAGDPVRGGGPRAPRVVREQTLWSWRAWAILGGVAPGRRLKVSLPPRERGGFRARGECGS